MTTLNTANKIVHLGFGAFHRAHQLLYTAETNQQATQQWRYYEVNLRNDSEIIEQLKAQNYQLHVLEKGAKNKRLKEVKAVIEYAYHPALDGIDAILERMADPEVVIVSLTVTEKGYCLDPASGKLDLNNREIQADLKNPTVPVSAIGYIVRALQLRKERGIPAFSVMSCDNLMENGFVAKNAVLGFASHLDPALADWIEQNSSFPCTMVDRIVPAMTTYSLQEVADVLGQSDPCGVVCEEYRQWVIEDHFVSGRPEWNLIGAELVEDVRPFEEMKLRMLNGSHSFLAYLGYLAGYAHISDCMQDKNYHTAAHQLMLNEQAVTLCMPQGIDLTRYANQLIERYENPNIKHRTWQIAMDGSQKLPIRMLASIRYHLAKGSSFKLLALGVAGWARYVSGVDEQNQPIDVKDPMVEKFQQIYAQHGLTLAALDELLNLEAIFPSELTSNALFVEEVRAAFTSLLQVGAKQTVANYINA
ncbi:mannitol-1-phosphate 5-dehydrogenase [[Pasteurella] mairii]|uniref:Mannitol-1-phosphate 5-dehydrogenase n=1 Tax=[Pasteurella] mairii TaxID=757 RepID=A0A379B2K7_9PAST|nr:mannitol-1-phosphate 5-dehydrogenase [[Pasteurella] mairii]